MKVKLVMFVIMSFCVGIFIGGFIFSQTISRPIFLARACESNCLNKENIAALLLSAGINVSTKFIPRVTAESDKCIAIKHWSPKGRYHTVFFPKKDALNIMSLDVDDMEYFLDCLSLAKEQVEKAGYSHYRFVSNGPALQHLSYFHFHIIAG